MRVQLRVRKLRSGRGPGRAHDRRRPCSDDSSEAAPTSAAAPPSSVAPSLDRPRGGHDHDRRADDHHGPSATTTEAAAVTTDAPTTTVAPATTGAPTTAAAPEVAWVMQDAPEDCMCADGSEFNFWSRTDDPEKVVLYFQGGGACFSAESCSFTDGSYDPTSMTVDDPTNASGIFDFENARQPASPAGPSSTCRTAPATCTSATPRPCTRRSSPSSTTATATPKPPSTSWSRLPDAAEVFVTGSSAGGIPSPLFGGLVSDRLPAPGRGPGRHAQAATAERAGHQRRDRRAVGNRRAHPRLARDERPHARAVRRARTSSCSPARTTPRSAWPATTTHGTRRNAPSPSATGMGDILAPARCSTERGARRGAPASICSVYIAPGDNHTILLRPEAYTLTVEGVPFIDWLTSSSRATCPVTCAAPTASRRPTYCHHGLTPVRPVRALRGSRPSRSLAGVAPRAWSTSTVGVVSERSTPAASSAGDVLAPVAEARTTHGERASGVSSSPAATIAATTRPSRSGAWPNGKMSVNTIVEASVPGSQLLHDEAVRTLGHDGSVRLGRAARRPTARTRRHRRLAGRMDGGDRRRDARRPRCGPPDDGRIPVPVQRGCPRRVTADPAGEHVVPSTSSRPSWTPGRTRGAGTLSSPRAPSNTAASLATTVLSVGCARGR